MDYFRNLNIKEIIINTLAQLFVRSTTTIATFAAIFLITYFQGYSLLGEVTKIISYVTFFYLLVDFGLNAIFIKHFQKDINKYLINIVVLRIIIASILAVAAIGIAALLPYNAATDTGFSANEKTGIILYSLTIITHGLMLSLQSILQKNLKYKMSIVPNIASSIILVSIIAFGATQANLHIILFAYLIAQSAFNIILFIRIKKHFNTQTSPINFLPFTRFILKTSFPLALVLFFNLIHAKADIFILSLMQPSFDVGVYGFSYRIFDFLIIIPAFLSNSMYPLLLKQKTASTYRKDIQKYAVLLLALSLVIMFTTFFAAPLLKYIRGDFALSTPPLQILSLSLPFFFLTSLFQWVMIINGKMKALAIIYATTMLINIALNIIYIPQFSYFAAATTTIIAEGMVFSLMVLYFMLERTKFFQNKP